eukprot:gnl/Dysnectes_brevis/2709_a3286_1294.p1 GENE.gnl/Dysnectes_brevis/2709_a3286_1294~~gnl/Dysnectes_brevis/2709_a3286_1294.p1  ORF type:complete len:258 (-),score=11.76 gnl/Dysnectes_brevis/2709_a3286_1294:21-794(-)
MTDTSRPQISDTPQSDGIIAPTPVLVPEDPLVQAEAEELKKQGNTAYKHGDFKAAIELYSQGIDLCRLSSPIRVALLSNRGLVYSKHKHLTPSEPPTPTPTPTPSTHVLTATDDQPDYMQLAVNDWTHVIEIDPDHLKSKLRLAYHYESLEKWIECKRYWSMIPDDQIKTSSERRRKSKAVRLGTEMEREQLKETLDKLKGLGNKVLGRFGLSLDNFKVSKGEGGGYSIGFSREEPQPQPAASAEAADAEAEVADDQ